MKELLSSLIKLFPDVKEYTILCSKDLYSTMLQELNKDLTGSIEAPFLIKSFEMSGISFNLREGLSVEKGFKVEF
mgnify:CR=1 FL=1